MMTPIKLASTLIGAQLVMAGAFGLAMPAHAHADDGAPSIIAPASPDRVWVNMAVCANEDGNTDGKVCLWVDPDTGDGYVVTSENYR